MRTFTSKSPDTIILQVRAGSDLATQAVVLLNDRSFRHKLVQAGLVDALLDFLDNCASQTFEEALRGGDVAFASVWVNGLLNTVSKDSLPKKLLIETRVKIASRLGPLIECMSLPQRELFQSRREWLGTLVFFVGLIDNLALSAPAVPILLRYESAVDFVVQALFWDPYRPDIVQEMSEARRFMPLQSGTLIRNAAAEALQEFCDVKRVSRTYGETPFDEEGMGRLKRLVEIRAVSSDYSSPDTVDLTLATGLLDIMPRFVHDASPRGLDSLLYVLQQISIATGIGALGPGAVAKLVALASTSPTAPIATSYVMAILNLVIVASGEPGASMPDDVQFAKAIEAGLLETMLQLLQKYSSGSVGQPRLVELVDTLLHAAGVVALSRKSGKAIRERSTALRTNAASVIRSGCCVPQAKIVQAIVDKAVQADSKAKITDGRLSLCRWCQTRSESVRRCGGCKRATYCSKECQVQDWKKGGHKQECKLMATNEVRAAGTGANKTEIRNLKRFEENLSAAGNNLFSETHGDIIMQATLRGYDVVNCVTVFDFTETPPTIITKPIAEFLAEAQLATEQAHFEHTKLVVERNQRNGALTIACRACNDSKVQSSLLKTFRSQPALNWIDEQEMLRQRMGAKLDEIRSDPSKLQPILKSLTRSRDEGDDSTQRISSNSGREEQGTNSVQRE